MKLFNWLTVEQKEAMAEWFITYQQYVGTGKGLFGTITEPLKIILTVGGFTAAVVAPEILVQNAVIGVAGVFVLFIVLPYYAGRWWDTKAYFRKQAVWANKRNDLKEQVDRIEKLLLERKA